MATTGFFFIIGEKFPNRLVKQKMSDVPNNHEGLKTSKILVQVLKALARIEALERQDDLERPHFVGADQDYVFESDLHYGTYSGLRYGTVLDPYGLMAILGFLVFLFYLIYNYLNASGNASTGRGLTLQKLISQNEAAEEAERVINLLALARKLHE